MSDKEIVIIGAGLGGLMCGALLSKEGYRVTIIEKNNQIGGGLQSYHRFGVTFDTGMHVFGGMQPHGNIRKICDYLGITEKFVTVDLDVEKDTEVYIHEDKETYFFSLHQERFIDSLNQYFPNQKEDLKAYCQALRNIMNHFDLFTLRNRDSHVINNNGDLYLSADALIEKYIHDSKLRTLLSTLSVLYAGEKDVSPSLLHAAISVIFMNGACRIAGGYSTFAEALSDCIIENGGKILKGEAIENIVSWGNNIDKLISQTGKIIKGDDYISSLPFSSMMKMFDGEFHMSKAYQTWMNMKEPSLSAFIINIKLRPKSFKYFNRIGFYLEHHSDVWKASDGKDVRRFMYMTPPSINQGEYAETFNVIVPMEWAAVSQWENTRVGMRGDDYLLFKERIKNLVLEKLSLIFPNFQDLIEEIDTSSPLTIRDYTGTVNGSMCGYRKDYHDPLLFMPVTTRIPNLFLTGQCVNLHGFCGVTLTAIETCEAIVGRNNLIRKINQI